MNKKEAKRIPMKFSSMTEEEKDNVLKTLIVLVFNSNPTEEFPILKKYAHYGGEAFDDLIEIEEDKESFYFKRKVK